MFTGASFSLADLRGAIFADTFPSEVSLLNAISPEGVVQGLHLNAGERLIIRDDDGVPDPSPVLWQTPRPPIPVSIQDHLTIVGGILQILVDADSWNSTISFEPGIPVTLGGTLELNFATGVNLASQVGRTFDLFDWTGVNPIGQFQIASPYTWDLTNLYTTGEITLTAVAGMAGDFNQNGVVDAADYVVWRYGFGTTYTHEHYNTWRTNFGATIVAGSAAALPLSATVPEPANVALICVGVVALCVVRVARDPVSSL
jgi:hypothetical protein